MFIIIPKLLTPKMGVCASCSSSFIFSSTTKREREREIVWIGPKPVEVRVDARRREKRERACFCYKCFTMKIWPRRVEIMAGLAYCDLNLLK